MMCSSVCPSGIPAGDTSGHWCSHGKPAPTIQAGTAHGICAKPLSNCGGGTRYCSNIRSRRMDEKSKCLTQRGFLLIKTSPENVDVPRYTKILATPLVQGNQKQSKTF